MEWPWAVTIPTTFLVSIGVVALAQWAQSQLFERAVNVVRRRLQAEVYTEAVIDAGMDQVHRMVSERLGPDVSAPEGDVEESLPKTESAGVVRAPVPSPADQRFTTLLIEYYAYGLTQARRSFGVSLTCSMLGGLVLMTGVSLAIFRADTDGQQYASITASVAGLLTTAIGSLFHRRADLALKHMESQTQSLRQDMKVERDAGQAIHLLRQVKDPTLKAHLQAALVLKFSAAKLPELNGVLKPTEALPKPSDNGAVPHQQAEAASS